MVFHSQRLFKEKMMNVEIKHNTTSGAEAAPCYRLRDYTLHALCNAKSLKAKRFSQKLLLLTLSLFLDHLLFFAAYPKKTVSRYQATSKNNQWRSE